MNAPRTVLYVVEVVEHATDKVVQRIGEPGMSESKAYRVDSGVNINMDHERFCSRVVEVTP